MPLERCGTCGHPRENHIAGSGKCYAETTLPDSLIEFEGCTICDKFEPLVMCDICGAKEAEHVLPGERRRVADLSDPAELTFKEHIFRPRSTK
jgi:hypothetical protein